ncbi:MAG TPA: hypothetical protein VML19_29480 [Verrucomicrobiae bacterium]|nr:hypothetical protein [Verrucomicrobiae bacterium]
MPIPNGQWIIITEYSNSDIGPAMGWTCPGPSILVVEDPLVGKLVHSVLRRSGYAAHAASFAEAFDLLNGGASLVSLLITNRPEVFLQFAERCRLLYMAACPDHDLASRFRCCQVLHKPFHPAELLNAVKMLLGSE